VLLVQMSARLHAQSSFESAVKIILDDSIALLELNLETFSFWLANIWLLSCNAGLSLHSSNLSAKSGQMMGLHVDAPSERVVPFW